MSVCSEKMLNIVPLLGIVLSHVFRTLAIIVPCTIVGYAVPVRGNLFRCLCSDCYNVFSRKKIRQFLYKRYRQRTKFLIKYQSLTRVSPEEMKEPIPETNFYYVVALLEGLGFCNVKDAHDGSEN